jgi:hypothetical protein
MIIIIHILSRASSSLNIGYNNISQIGQMDAVHLVLALQPIFLLYAIVYALIERLAKQNSIRPAETSEMILIASLYDG